MRDAGAVNPYPSGVMMDSSPSNTAGSSFNSVADDVDDDVNDDDVAADVARDPGVKILVLVVVVKWTTLFR